MAKKTTAEKLATIQKGYTLDGATIELGAAIVDGELHKEAQIRLPLSMMNRHGLVAGATGTGKTVTLHMMAEQLSAAGVPVFLADIKGDLSGLATAAAGSEKLKARTDSIGQAWAGKTYPVEFLALGGDGNGIPVRATITSFGPILLSRVMELNDTQESSLQLVFHFADKNNLELIDLKDLRAVIQFLTSDEGKDELEELGGLSKATAGVILRELVNLEAQGLEKFFGEPEFDTAELLRTAPDGRGVVTCLELPTLQTKPMLFSTFLMWLLADLFEDLPEAGDLDKPKLVFFLDEAHLLFNGASKAFLNAITTTVRLIRSKGVGIFFVTQTPKDVPADVLGQLANRIQHALRAFTPEDAKALKATVSTFPVSDYDLEETLTSAGIGEAVITVMNEKGAPTPVALTRLRAPESVMGPSTDELIQNTVAGSALLSKYGTAVDNISAYEKLTGKAAAPTGDAAPGQPPVPSSAGRGDAGQAGGSQADVDAEARRIEEEILGRPSSRPAPAPDRGSAPERARAPRAPEPAAPAGGGIAGDLAGVLGGALGGGLKSMVRSMGTQLGRELLRGVFGTSSRRRR
ncbi:helicase HerA-like domain-containing protein [Pseudarthrobacter sulfonivorans]|uniref:helicase HerA-like domain-containing protein n=1 Tax=Pseudarthrobacter sulfonivorans TaxID=121292 RepID=UPI002854D31D|nr:helicase HerA-like domain-containing protein [Pseudarthrobacter sulfonivorans]MDR6416612.1 DNA helicase HerA-like ATPase [Pseudarthrobacter sulfonivorans]